jgi:hypothetical protein
MPYNAHKSGSPTVLKARIGEMFPLLCPICGGQIRIIAFIKHSADIRQIPVPLGQILNYHKLHQYVDRLVG